MEKIHRVEKITFPENHLLLSVDGEIYLFPLEVISPRLAKASAAERNIYQKFWDLIPRHL